MPIRPRTAALLLALTACTPDAGAGTDAPATGTDAPTTDAPTTDTPTTDGPTTDAPTTDAPTTDAPTTDASTTEAPDPDTTTTGDPLACAIAPAILEHGEAPPDTFKLEKLDLQQHPLAVCNDGSPAAYAIRPGVGPGRDRWVFFLSGGGQCADLASCTARWKSDDKPKGRTLMGSSGYDADDLDVQVSRGGPFSPDPLENPLFYDATLVRVFYCSSDLWSGDRGATPGAELGEIGFWHFRGRRIIEGVLADLGAKYQLGDATEMLYAGGSAGGFGVFNTIDDVAAVMPPKVRFLGLPDAGLFIDYPAYDPKTGEESLDDPSLIYQVTLAGHETWGGSGDTSCTAAAADDAARLRCRGPANMVADDHIETPMLIVQSEFDNNQTERLGVALDAQTGDAPDAAQQAWRERFAASMRDSLAAASPWHAVWGHYIHYHTVVTRDDGPNAFTKQQIDDTSLSKFMQAWYLDPCAPQRLIEPPN